MYWRKCVSDSESRSGISTSSPLACGMSSGNPPVNSPVFLQRVPNRCPSHDRRTKSAVLKGQFDTTLRGVGINPFWISDVHTCGNGFRVLSGSMRGIKVVHFEGVDWRMHSAVYKWLIMFGWWSSPLKLTWHWARLSRRLLGFLWSLFSGILMRERNLQPCAPNPFFSWSLNNSLVIILYLAGQLLSTTLPRTSESQKKL